MPADLFRDSLADHPGSARPRSSWLLSLLVHGAVITAAVRVPLLATDTLPAPFRTTESCAGLAPTPLPSTAPGAMMSADAQP